MHPPPTVSDELIEILPGMQLIATLDMEGRISSPAAGMARLLGCNVSDLTGEYIETLAHPDVPAALFVDMWRDLRAGRPWSSVIKIQCRNGDPRWARMNVVPVRTHGRVVSYISMLERALSRDVGCAALAFRHVAEGNDDSGFEHGRFASAGLGARVVRKMSAVSLRARLAGGVALALVPTALIAVLALSFATGRYQVSASLAVALVVSMLAGLGVAVIWWRLEQRLAAGLRLADSAIARMVDGDFVAPIECGGDDEVGRLLQNLAELQVTLALDMQRVNDPAGCPSAPDTRVEREAEARAVTLTRMADRLVSQAEQLMSGSEAQVKAIDRMIALAHESSVAEPLQTAESCDDEGAHGVRRAIEAVSVELDAIGQALAPASALSSDAGLLAFEVKLLALNFALAHGSDERVGSPVLVAEARDRAHDAGRIVSSLRDMVDQLRSRLAQSKSLLLAAGEALVTPGAVPPDVDGVGLHASGKLWGELQDMLEAVRSDRAAADRIVLLAVELKSMLHDRPSGESGEDDVSNQAGVSSINTDVIAGGAAPAAEDTSLKLSGSSLRSARTSAKISRLRPARHEVGAPVPRVRRTAVQGLSIEDEWEKLRE